MLTRSNRIQLGKNGVTANFIATLKSNFEKHKIVRIAVLKSACRDRDELKEISMKILKELGEGYSARVIGFVIVVLKRKRK